MSSRHYNHALEHAVCESVAFVLAQYQSFDTTESDRRRIAVEVKDRVKAHLLAGDKHEAKVVVRRQAPHRGNGVIPAEEELP